MLTPYSYTLFVDPSGSNTTAIIGDYTKPWQTINAAINYAGTSSQPTGGYTIHIFRGNYTATQSVTYAANKSISLFFEPNANLDVSFTSVGYWFNHDGGTASINISGSGKSTNYISSNYGVFKVGGSGTSQATAYSHVLNIHDIRISSTNAANYTSSGNGVVLYSTKSSVNIDNSTISLTTAGGVNIYQCVIWFTQGYLSTLDTTIEMSSQTAQPTYPAASTTHGWLIYENGLVSGTTDVGRIRLQNTYLSQYGTGGGGAIYSSGQGYPTTTQSIFLANVYYQAIVSKTYTVYCYPKQDSVYIGGSVISGGLSPDYAWSSGFGAFQNPAPATVLAIYNLGNSNMPRPY
jgi:hypothetical protein